MKTLLLVLLGLSSLKGFSQTAWRPVSYEVMFKIKNAGITVTGRFTGLQADLKFNPDKPESAHLAASVAVNTIKTGIGKRDDDLQGETYFDAKKYPSVKMESVKVYRKGNGYAGKFKVTIKGTTKEVEMPFSFTQKGNEGEFKGSFTINRRDFGVGGRTLTMSDDADVSIDIKVKS